jgi:hypothetical protein
MEFRAGKARYCELLLQNLVASLERVIIMIIIHISNPICLVGHETYNLSESYRITNLSKSK